MPMKIPEAIRQDKNIKWILLIGLLQTAACAVTYWFRISNPNIILIVILSAALVQFGYKAGLWCIEHILRIKKITDGHTDSTA